MPSHHGQATAFTSGGAAGRVPAGQLTWHRIRRATRATPGRLRLLGTGLVILSLLVTVVAAAGVQARADAVHDLRTSSGPLSIEALGIYQALSDADATASTAFLAGGRIPDDVRDRYRRDIAQATTSLTAATSAGGTGPAIRQLHRLSSQLPVYTDQIATARVHHRVGQPLGAAYLRQASGLMREQMLPAARKLYELQNGQLARDQARAAGSLPWSAGLLALVLLAGLVAAQVDLRRRTNRVLNAGLLAATAACLTALVWTVVALVGAAGHLDAATRDGSAPMQALGEARIAAFQARSQESLSLVGRGDQSTAAEERYTTTDRLLGGAEGHGGLLGKAEDLLADGDAVTRDAVADAITSLQAWRTAHEDIRAADSAGNYQEAVAASVGDQPGSAVNAFDDLDQALASAIGGGRTRFAEEVGEADTTLATVPGMIVLLGVVTAAGIVVGIGRRLREYR